METGVLVSALLNLYFPSEDALPPLQFEAYDLVFGIKTRTRLLAVSAQPVPPVCAARGFCFLQPLLREDHSQLTHRVQVRMSTFPSYKV